MTMNITYVITVVINKIECALAYIYNAYYRHKNNYKNMTGKVYIASMNMRGKWADPIINNYIKINVTSAQSKKSKNRINFSPMTEIENSYKGFWNFESYWQSGKVFENIPFETTQKWWIALKQAKRRYPKTKGKKVLYALFDNEQMDYVTSRKKIYVPEYYDLIKNKNIINEYKKILQDGKNIIIYDFDGPRDNNNNILCLELTNELLINKINDTRHPFGHGYIVGACINNMDPSYYIN